MSYHLIDLSQDIDFDFDDILIGRKIILDNISSRYYIYMMENKEIYIKLPKVRLIYHMGNNKYTQSNIPIYPNNNMVNNFIEFIKTFENDIFECFKNKHKEFSKEFSSLISKKNSFNFIKTNISDTMKPIITSNLNKKVELNDFKINSEIEIVIKISYIWTNENKIGLSSQLYQIKYYAPPEELMIDFIDDNNIKEQKILPEKIVRCLASQNNLTGKLETSLVPIPKIIPEQGPIMPIKMVPSIKDLQNALKGLKPVE